jgi:hypothetical protein
LKNGLGMPSGLKPNRVPWKRPTLRPGHRARSLR